MTVTPQRTEVQAQFLTEICQEGMAHTLQRMGGWYEAFAKAEVADLLATHAKIAPNDKELQLRIFLSMAMENTPRAFDCSTGVGRNLYRQALAAAVGDLLRKKGQVTFDAQRAAAFERVRAANAQK
jgi:hypothetical protein